LDPGKFLLTRGVASPLKRKVYNFRFCHSSRIPPGCTQ